MRLASRFAFARGFAFCVAFSAAVAASLGAEEGRLFPREVFVGDSAELSFRWPALANVLDEGVAVTLSPADVPVSNDLDISSVSALKTNGNAVVTIAFVPWATGTVSFPSLTIRAVAVSPPAARISSIVEKTGKTSLERERPPLLVPGTTWLLYGLIAASLAACALAVVLVIRLRSFLFSPGDRRSVRLRARILSRALKALERTADSTDGAQWYRAYARAMRQYLGACFAGSFDAFLSLTGTEIALSADSSFSGRVASLFSDLDAIRFGGAEVESMPGKAVFLNRARELSSDLESWLAEKGGDDAGL